MSKLLTDNVIWDHDSWFYCMETFVVQTIPNIPNGQHLHGYAVFPKAELQDCNSLTVTEFILSCWEKYQMNFADLQRKKPWGEKAFSKLSLNPLYSSVHLSSLNKCCWMQTKHNHPHDNSFWWSFIAMCHFQMFLSHMNPLHLSQVQWFTLLKCIWLTVNKNVSMQILNFLLLIPFGCNHRVNEIKVKRSLLEV